MIVRIVVLVFKFPIGQSVVAIIGTRLRDTIIVLTFVLVCIMYIIPFRALTPLTVEREKPLGGGPSR